MGEVLRSRWQNVVLVLCYSRMLVVGPAAVTRQPTSRSTAGGESPSFLSISVTACAGGAIFSENRREREDFIMTSNRIPRRAFLKTGAVGAVALASPEMARSLLAAQTGTQETHSRPVGRRQTTVAEDMGTWVAELRYEDLPPAVVEKAKRVLLDTVGCALGAVDAEPVRFAQQAVFLQGGHPRSTLIGLGRKVSCDQAAFLNGMAIRYLSK